MRSPAFLMPLLSAPAAVAGRVATRAFVLAAVGVAAAIVADARAARADDAHAPPATAFGEFLTLRDIDLPNRGVLLEAGPWDDARERVLIRVLARLAAPANIVAEWRMGAVATAARGSATEIGDRLVRVRGRATFVAPRVLPPELAELAARQRYDVVRIVDELGAVVEVVTPRAPRAWPRWRTIDEPAVAVGLPLSREAGPRPALSGEGGEPWPAAAPDLLVAATAVEWRPPTPLGRLGMDYGLFDAVVDEDDLSPGDTAAFWSVLEAAARATPEAIAAAAGGRTAVVPLIDPAQQWFASHRGDPVMIEGVARMARRIAIEDPAMRSRCGTDHYWELEVFVDTPLLRVNDHLQDRYPIVCCVVALTEGMPSGQEISERVRVPGFAFKRYAYRTRDASASSSRGDSGATGIRIATPLVIGPRAEWVRPPSPAGVSNLLFVIFAALGALLAVLVASNSWSLGREARRAERRRRDAMPDRIELPP